MKKPLLALAAGAAVLAVASPAAAAPSGDTIVTFTVSTANLDITVPASVNLGAAFAGSTLSGSLGNVTVTDSRAALSATWTASVTSTAFTTGGGSAEETILPNLVEYWSGPAISTTGTGTFVPGQPTSADAVTLNLPRTAFSKTSGSGNNTATWNPSLRITLPPAAVGGLYSGTVTHSVA
ncbi:hypothetical protein [Micromonospora rifamycinica]|uniref:WxL domain surface cell wall-binding n=1 Tax=Micromonospora rifamycinica TaxID=291594 RepID=A0A125Q0V3_9ACTN|nr:hypothetical protein [Micromonospora rifamycinica]KWV30202.1 hypothetical protein AWV63_24285 [Micromonospora rifamycinica]SCG45827.1 hypothetical protein GA0070623_1293 [Micromonospora rifamycinica]